MHGHVPRLASGTPNAAARGSIPFLCAIVASAFLAGCATTYYSKTEKGEVRIRKGLADRMIIAPEGHVALEPSPIAADAATTMAIHAMTKGGDVLQRVLETGEKVAKESNAKQEQP